MRVSHRWLQELLPALALTPREIAETLTRAGLEVEAVERLGAGLETVEIVEVALVEPHPRRDGLRLVTVTRGAGATQRVVCGAPNVPPPGGLVALAPVGTHLPAVGLTLAPKEIGGVPSEGMLCSERELGLGGEGGGILVLPPGTAAPGVPLVRATPAQDTVFTLNVTPNRPDALGHVGVARELAALLELPFAPPGIGRPPERADGSVAELVTIENDAKDRCGLYGAAVVLDVTVAPSPLAVRWRLHALGVRPLDRVVDLTNWILLEWGQPLHAFDLDRVRGGRIVVRRARPGEPFTTLDGVRRELDADDLVIADGEGPTALAGVMGGRDSEIRPETRRVLLECAWFEPRGTRRAARRHGLHTESSHRFERGVDHGATAAVLALAEARLAEWTGGRAAREPLLVPGEVPEPRRVRWRPARASSLLGVPVDPQRADALLTRLGFSVEREGEERAVLVPSFRPDVQREVDLIEEVARVEGLDRLPPSLPRLPAGAPTGAGAMQRRATELAASLGLSEALLLGFCSKRELEVLGASPPVVELENPLSAERHVLRTSLLPGLLEALRRARRHGERDIRLFAVASRFLAPSTAPRAPRLREARPLDEGERAALPEERLTFAMVLAGRRPGWLGRAEEVDVWDAKGVLEALLGRLSGREVLVEGLAGPARPSHLHPRGAAAVSVGEVRVGSFGPLHPDVVEALDLDGPALVGEVDLDAVESLGETVARYRPIPRLPAVTRDLSLTVGERVAAASVQAAVTEAAGPLCESVTLLDEYRDPSLGDGMRSLTFRLVYRDPLARSDPERARTLTDREVDERHAAVVRATEARTGAALRR